VNAFIVVILVCALSAC